MVYDRRRWWSVCAADTLFELCDFSGFSKASVREWVRAVEDASIYLRRYLADLRYPVEDVSIYLRRDPGSQILVCFALCVSI